MALKRQVLLAIGGNVGNVAKNALLAIKALPRLGITPLALSRKYETRAVTWPGDPPQAMYTNMAVLTESALGPEDIVARCHRLAMDFGARGQTPSGRWAHRPLDIDTIAIDDVVYNAPDCVLPHPRAFVRPFVLWPARDVAPHLIVGPAGRTAAACLSLLVRNNDGIATFALTWCGNDART